MRVRKVRAKDCDKRILLTAVVLTAIGVILVASSSSFFSAMKFSDPYFLLKRHLVRVLVAAVFLFVAMRIDYRLYRRASPGFYAVGVGLLLGLFIFGYTVRNSLRWYRMDFLNLSFQPAEIARLSLVFFLAYWISKKGSELRNLKEGFAPAALAVLFVVILMASQPSYGSAAATFLVATFMLYVGGARARDVLAFNGTFVLGAGLKLWSQPYARERIVAFFHRGEGLREANWQVYQSLVGLGSGGVWGAGFGGSRQKLNWLPDSHTDFIFSILGEEVGLTGTLAVSFLFLLLVLRGLKISRRCGDVFGGMLAFGISSSIFIYAALNMAVATGLLPVTGLPLPLISYGGTALLVNLFSVGVLLNVSRVGRAVRSSARRRGRIL